MTLSGSSPTTPFDVFTYTVDGPQVVKVRRYGLHAQSTYLVISFDSALDPSPAQNVSNYQIAGPGNHRIKVRSAMYNSAMDAVTLRLAQRLILRTTYQLTINGMPTSGLKNPEGLFLDGAGNGQPGTNYVALVTRSNLAGAVGQEEVAKSSAARARRVADFVKVALSRCARQLQYHMRGRPSH